MKKLTTLLFVTGFFLNETSAQDFHLTQYDAAPQYLNPALTGVFSDPDADYRIGLNYRSQWSALAKPFVTSGLNFDMKIDDKFNAGIVIMNNKGSAGTYNSFILGLSGSYNVIDDKDAPHRLTTGVQIGLLNLSSSGDNFNFGTQYSANSENGFDQGISSGEIFNKQSIFRFDAAFGVYYKYQQEGEKIHPFGGVSVYHIPRPKESFTGHDVRYPMRWNIHAGADYFVDDKLTITPTFLFMTQAKATEVNAGVYGTYLLKEKGDINYRGILGLNFRSGKDAIMFQLGVMKNYHTLRFSYDYNTSFLKNYTSGRGAWEISLILHGKKGEDFFKSFTSF